MLKTRILTAAVLIPAVLAALFLLPSRQWGLLVLVIVAIGANEWSLLVGLPDALRVVFIVIIVAIAVPLLFLPSAPFARGVNLAFMGAAAGFWIALATPWVVSRWPTRAHIPMMVVGGCVLLGAWTALIELQARSPWLVLAAMAIVWIADTAAYFSGRAFGRRKLAPEVSPGKTWEGVWGGWVAVAVYAALLVPFATDAGFRFPVTPLAIAAWIVFAILTASISVVGDLFESLLKRHAGAKDSGTLLPGHGGVLDRTDALLAAMPIAALAARMFL
jgi:phosphatidate cytidylyltransferase